MPMWRCPHCGTPQAETARCWVCRRSSTACGTCRNFRSSVAGSLGYCGLDRAREPLVGDEIRPCWEASPGVADLALPAPVSMPEAMGGVAGPVRVAHLEFVEVGQRSPADPGGIPGALTGLHEPALLASEPIIALPIRPDGETGWSLWGDPDR